MTELKEAVFGRQMPENEQTIPPPSISDMEEEAEEAVRSVPDSPDDLYLVGLNTTEQMRLELEKENEKLEQRFSASIKTEAVVKSKEDEKKRPAYIVGVLSASASLIFMGIAVLVSLSSPIGPYAALKVSPVILIFFGVEILFFVVKNKSFNIRIDLRSIIVSSVLILTAALLSLTSATGKAEGSDRVYAQERIQNMIAGELHDKIAHDNIKNVDIEINLYGENAELYETPADLTDGDIINLTVHFFDAQMPIREFARDCREILDGVLSLRYNFGNIKFIADDGINLYTLDIDCLYQSDFSADKLAGMVNFFGDGISDTDIPDISDDE